MDIPVTARFVNDQVSTQFINGQVTDQFTKGQAHVWFSDRYVSLEI